MLSVNFGTLVSALGPKPNSVYWFNKKIHNFPLNLHWVSILLITGMITCYRFLFVCYLKDSNGMLQHSLRGVEICISLQHIIAPALIKKGCLPSQRRREARRALQCKRLGKVLIQKETSPNTGNLQNSRVSMNDKNTIWWQHIYFLFNLNKLWGYLSIKAILDMT